LENSDEMIQDLVQDATQFKVNS